MTMDSKVKYGVYTVLIWNWIIAINIILRTTLVSTPLDLSSPGMKFFFILWSVVMFGVGYLARKDYLIKEQVFIDRFKNLPQNEVKELFKTEFCSKSARMFFYISIGAIPWFIIGYWTEVSRTTTYIFCLALAVIAITLYIVQKLLERNIREKTNKMSKSIE